MSASANNTVLSGWSSSAPSQALSQLIKPSAAEHQSLAWSDATRREAQRAAAPAAAPITVLVACAVRLYREGLATSLQQHAPFHIRFIGTASNAEDAVSLTREHKPTLVLLDAAFGASLTRELIQSSPDTRVLVLAINESDDDVIAVAEAGVAGYLPRDGSHDDLLAAIERAARGEVLCPPKIVASLFRHMASRARPRGAAALPGLTLREREVVELLGQGLSNKEIARRLAIRVATVKNHVHSILQKLGVTRRFAVAAMFMRHDAP